MLKARMLITIAATSAFIIVSLFLPLRQDASGETHSCCFQGPLTSITSYAPVQNISTPETDFIADPTMAIDNQGNIHVAWESYSNYLAMDTFHRIYYRWFNASTRTWSPVEIVSQSSTISNSYDPVIGVDAAGNVYFIWEDYIDYNGAGTDLDIMYKCRNMTTGAWMSMEVVSDGSVGSTDPAVAIDTANNVHVAWMEGTHPNVNVTYKMRNASTAAWTVQEIVTTENVGAVSPDIDTDLSGNVYVAYVDDMNISGSGSDYDIFMKVKDEKTQAWGAPVVVSVDSPGASWYPSIRVTSLGGVHVAWHDDTNLLGCGTDDDIFYRYKPARTSLWGPVEVVSTESTRDSWKPSIDFDGYGNVHVAWSDYTDFGGAGGLDRDIFYKVKNSLFGTWGNTVVVSSTSSGQSQQVTVQVDPQDAPHFVWDDMNASPNQVWYTFRNTHPVIPSIPDILYPYGTLNNSLTWTVADDRVVAPLYTIYLDGTNLISGFWTPFTPIVLNVDFLDVGNHNFTIVVDDGYGGTSMDQAWVTVTNVNPLLFPSPDVSYYYGVNGNTIQWTVTDSSTNATWFVLYQDGYGVKSGNWSSIDVISFGVDGLGIGMHNFTVVVNDGLGCFASDTIWVTVLNHVPFVVSPEDEAFSVGATGHVLSWTVIDLDVITGTYSVYRNTSQLVSGMWTSGSPFNISLDNLVVGHYNYTIVVLDGLGGTLSDTACVTVLNAFPAITSPPDVSFSVGSLGNMLSWLVIDDTTGVATFDTYLDGEHQEGGFWISGVQINVSLDSISLGTHNFSIILSDGLGRIIQDNVVVHVTNHLPLFTSPIDVMYTTGSSGHYLTWLASDPTTGLSSYAIYQNDTHVTGGPWNSGEAVNISIDGLLAGVYNFTIVINDGLGGLAQDTVIVSVVSPDNTWLVITLILTISGVLVAIFLLIFWKQGHLIKKRR